LLLAISLEVEDLPLGNLFASLGIGWIERIQQCQDKQRQQRCREHRLYLRFIDSVGLKGACWIIRNDGPSRTRLPEADFCSSSVLLDETRLVVEHDDLKFSTEVTKEPWVHESEFMSTVDRTVYP
jgi:hypothetical protein